MATIKYETFDTFLRDFQYLEFLFFSKILSNLSMKSNNFSVCVCFSPMISKNENVKTSYELFFGTLDYWCYSFYWQIQTMYKSHRMCCYVLSPRISHLFQFLFKIYLFTNTPIAKRTGLHDFCLVSIHSYRVYYTMLWFRLSGFVFRAIPCIVRVSIVLLLNNNRRH